MTTAASDPRRLTGIEVAIVAAFAAVGAAFVAFPHRLADMLSDTLPLAVTAASGGTIFGAFGEVGADLVRRSGAALLIAVAASMLLHRGGRTLIDRTPTTGDGSVLALGLDIEDAVWRVGMFAVGYIAFHYFGSPHNAFSTNSRIHWVDFTSWDSDNFFYAAGHLPHTLFYRHPAWWQGLNGGLLAVAMHQLVRRIGWSRLGAALLTVAFLGSSVVLLFADTAEDVLLNLLLLTLLMCSLTSGRTWLRGLALAGAVLGRPEFLSLIAVYAVAVGVLAVVDRLRATPAAWPTRQLIARHARVLGWAVVFVTLSQLVFTVLGDRYLFSHGRVLYLRQLQDLQPTVVHGYLISKFGGAYAGHFLWVIPPMLLVAVAIGAAVAIASVARRAERKPTTFVSTRLIGLFSLGSVAAIVLLHEAKPLSYYNIRYLSYSLPFLYVAALIAVRRTREWSAVIANLVLVASVLSLFTLPVNPFTTKHRVERRVELELFDRMDDLQSLRGHAVVFASFGGLTSRNGLAYVFHMNIEEITGVKVERARALLKAVDPPGGAVALVIANCDDIRDLLTDSMRVVDTGQLCAVRLGGE